jgi:hypothetical protein
MSVPLGREERVIDRELTAQIPTDLPKSIPTKPTKPGFVGFVGAMFGESPNIELGAEAVLTR